MAATTDEGLVIVTGASGHIGREVKKLRDLSECAKAAGGFCEVNHNQNENSGN
jgi:hypothetical protein